MSSKTSWIALLGICLSSATIADAQCAQPSWSAMNTVPGIGGVGFALTSWDPDGAGPGPSVLVAGGIFHFTSSCDAHRVAMWDGTAWSPLGAGLDGTVEALTTFGGSLIAGGDFVTSGGVSTNRVARWNGTSWEALGSGMNGPVRAFATYGGELVAGGSFTTAGGTPAASVARWNGTSWQPLGGGVSQWSTSPVGHVHTLTVKQGTLVASGLFATAGGVPASCVAEWDGSAWNPFPVGAGPTLAATMHAGEFFATGAFVPNLSGHHVARWTGTTWQAVGPVFSGQIYDLLSWNGDLIAAGQFMTIGGANIPRIARWNGSAWLPLAPAIDGPVWALTTWGGSLIAGGDFKRVSGDATGVAKWDGTSWHALGVGQGVAFTAFAEIHDALWATTSSMTNSSIPGPITGSLRRWDGTAWQTVGTMSNEAYAVREHQGQTIVGGAFSSVDGTPAQGIAVWTGSAWNGLGGGFSSVFGGVVRALAVYNGELIAAGSFSTAGGVAANNIARWNGMSWQPLAAGLNGAVRVLAEFNGELVAGGSFIGAGGSPAPSIARWNGSGWATLGSGITVGAGVPSVSGLAILGGALVAVGNFDTAGGLATPMSARWDGLTWQPLGPGFVGGVPLAATVFGGELVVGGSFSFGSGGPLNCAARWDGTSWQPLGAGLSRDGADTTPAVSSLTVHHGALLAGGNFHRANGLLSPYLARWSSPLPFMRLSAPPQTGSGVEIANRWLVPGHEYLNLASPNPCAAGLGSGPYGGLCVNDPAILLMQIQIPVGTPPFHFLAAGTDATFGPYALPVGFSFEAICVDVTGWAVGCISSTVGYTVY